MLGTPQILTYSVALGIAAAVPGPGMTALVARSVSGGIGVGFCMLLGLIAGDLFFLSSAVFGLALLVHHFSLVFVVIKFASLGYLLYLSWIFWNVQPQSFASEGPPQKKDLVSAWLSGLTITLGNPKTIAFYLALVPLVIDLTTISTQTWGLQLVPLTSLILLAVGSAFILGAVSLRRVLATASAQVMLYRGASVIMVLAALFMLFKN